MGNLIVGIDVGGTFTDVVAVDPERQELFTLKVPSQPGRPAKALLHGLTAVCERAGVSASGVARLVHGTTIATNAVLERKGARLGLLTTHGFEDILTIGRMMRTEIYDLFMDPEEPLFLVPRRQIAGIPERIDAQGQVLTPLDEQAVIDNVRRLRDDYDVQAIAICYLFAFLNPDHEARTAELINEHFPDLPVSRSSVVNPKFREYERLVVTAFDAYLRPVIAAYVGDLQQELRDHGFESGIQIMQSNGGITAAELAADRPVSTILSGPAAGVVAGNADGAAAGFPNLVTIDIGGTSCDVALIRDGTIGTAMEGRIDKYPLRVPMVDVHTIGSGGGSIAWLDPAGGLKVGPHSAGASPGPASYGWGGTEPAVTDASLVLGYLNPATFAGGGFDLRTDLAEQAIGERIAGPLGLSVPAAAAGIHDIVNTQMAQAVRLVSVNRGYDLRRIALVAQGGAGPVHIGRLLTLLNAQAAIVPIRPGVSSAYGLLLAEIRHEAARPYAVQVVEASVEDLERLYAEIDAHCQQRMTADGVSLADVRVNRVAEMRYVGQSFELSVPVPEGALSQDTLNELVRRFHQEHDRVYGYHSPASPVEFLGVQGIHSYPLPAPPHERVTAQGSVDEALAGSRLAYFSELGTYVETPLYDRGALPAGAAIVGPAILEQFDTTTVIYPGQTARVHESGIVIITATGKDG